MTHNTNLVPHIRCYLWVEDTGNKLWAGRDCWFQHVCLVWVPNTRTNWIWSFIMQALRITVGHRDSLMQLLSILKCKGKVVPFACFFSSLHWLTCFAEPSVIFRPDISYLFVCMRWFFCYMILTINGKGFANYSGCGWESRFQDSKNLPTIVNHPHRCIIIVLPT